MKLIYLFILSVSLFSCKNENGKNNAVKLEILNKELYFNNKYVKNHSSNQSYKNNEDRQKATNILTWKLTNSSSQNYLFIINEDDFFEDPFFGYDYNHIEITNKDNKKRNGGTSNILWSEDNSNVGSMFNCLPYNDSIRKLNYELKGGKLKDYKIQSDYVKNSFVLHPNESKIFKSIISLPILKEVTPKTYSSQIIVSSILEGDKFNIIYEWDSIKINKSLQKYQIQELKDNNINIFNGILRSNKVLLKSREQSSLVSHSSSFIPILWCSIASSTYLN